MKNAKKLVALLLALVMVFALTACGGSETPSGDGTGDASAEQYTLKMHLTVGTNDPVYKSAEKFKEIVESETNGNVVIELYPSSSIGVTSDCLEGLSLRVCDIVYDAFANLASLSGIANLDGAPYLYSSVEHFRDVWESDVGEQIRADLGEATGMKVMGGGLQGVRVITSNTPIQGPDDVKGLKIRVPTIDIYLATWEWLGASPTPLAGSEIFTALQQGTVNAQENPYPTCIGLSLNECCKYATESNHVYSCDMFIMDQAFFDSLPAEYQAAIEKAATEASALCTDLIVESTEAAKQQFVDDGIEIYEVDIAEWQEALDGFLAEKYPDLVDYQKMIAAIDPA